MKTINSKFKKYTFVVACLAFLATACSERDLDSLERDTQYPTTPEVFMDGFSGGEDLSAWGKVTNFNLDYSTVYDGSASIRIDVPSSSDAGGTWAGGNIYTSMPRDLSGYDCLTFYAKASVATTMTAGFGSGSDYYSYCNFNLTSTWTKFIIPIADASKLKAMTSMFYYSAAPLSDGSGYSMYIDDVKYEKLGTLAHKTIKNTFTSTLFLGEINTGDISLSVSLPSGGTQTVYTSPNYYTFSSSNSSVATVSGNTIDVIGAGTAHITASGFDGYLEITSNGIGAAPKPTYPSSEVLSIYSDSYSSATIYDFWCGSTSITPTSVASNNMYYFTSLDWTCMVVFNATTNVGYQNASGYNYLHIDIMTPSAVTSSSALGVNLGDYTSGSNVSKQIYTYTMTSSSQLKWIQLDIPVSSYTRSKVGYITFVGTNLKNLYVDNVYFHN